MNEEKGTKEEKQETSISDADKGIQSETTSELDRADQIAERQKRENDRREEILKREENLAARKVVGGGSEAGKVIDKKEETPEEYKDRVMRNDL